MLEKVINLIKALMKGRFKGGITIYFKDGGISSITVPKKVKDEVDIAKLNK